MKLSEPILNEPVVIDRPEALRPLVADLLKQATVAVDTESNSLHAYREQVCLIQFSTLQADYLLDPLAISDLSSLGPIFADPKIEKVFHAAEYDLICLRRDFGFTFANLFDTMMAASILGRTEIGLGAMLKNEFGLDVDKHFQRADWGQRPLPQELLSYARMDTHYLIPLRDRLKAELAANQRWPMAAEDFKRICKADLPGETGTKQNGDSAAASCWRISGANDLDPQQAAVLLELCRYRDHVARASNRPLFKVINDATLLAVAAALPVNMNELKELPGMTQGQLHRHGYQLLQAVQRGLDAHPVYPPRVQRPDEQYLSRLEALRTWRKNTAIQLGVKSDVVMARELLTAIAEQNPLNLAQLSAVLGESPWRLQRYGEQILRALGRKL